MKHISLQGVARTIGNKQTLKQIRRNEQVPCVIYGNNVENVNFSLDVKELKKITHTPASYIIDIDVEGKVYQCVFHAIQYHPVTDEALHADFLAINPEKPVVIDVPVVIVGNSEGVKQGGKLMVSSRKVMAAYDWCKGLKGEGENVGKLVEKGKITQEYMDATMNNITPTTDYATFADADLVIEAAVEEMHLKKEVFTELDKICGENTIFATNTSSLSITEIAACTSRPDRFIGMHFFNPAPVMKLIEVIKGQKTSDEVCNKIFELATAMGKVPVMVNEAPGFVVNRILIPMVNEGIGILADGVASAEDIDNAMKLGANHPMGPLALGDLIGLDVCLAIMEVLYNEYGDDKYRPHPLLRKMVRAGLLGRKTGEGFYKY